MISEMPVFNARRSTLLFWSAMDAFYICFVLFSSLRRGAIPFWTDLNEALTNMRNWGGGLEVMIWLGLAVQLSVVVSCVLFYRGGRSAIYFAAVQIPFRALFIVPSVSILLMVPTLIAGLSNWVWACLLVASELAKALSLWWLRRSPFS